MLSYKPYKLYRSQSTITDGEYVVSFSEAGTVRGSLQPVGAKESAGLPDEFRTEAKYKLYTKSVSLVINGTVQSGDVVTGDEIETPVGRLRVVGVEQQYPSLVSPSLLPMAHGKYYLNGGAGVPN